MENSLRQPTTPEENRRRVAALAASQGVKTPGDPQTTHGKDSPEGFAFITNISDPPDETNHMDFESEAQFVERLKSELGDDVCFTTPAYDVDGKPWKGTAIHVREHTEFIMHKPIGRELK